MLVVIDDLCLFYTFFIHVEGGADRIIPKGLMSWYFVISGSQSSLPHSSAWCHAKKGHYVGRVSLSSYTYLWHLFGLPRCLAGCLYSSFKKKRRSFSNPNHWVMCFCSPCDGVHNLLIALHLEGSTKPYRSLVPAGGRLSKHAPNQFNY